MVLKDRLPIVELDFDVHAVLLGRNPQLGGVVVGCRVIEFLQSSDMSCPSRCADEAASPFPACTRRCRYGTPSP